MSAYTNAKARKLLARGDISKVEGSLWQARSSKGDNVYVIDIDGPHCDCLGFKFRGKCSHILAVQIALESENSEKGAN